VFILARLSPGVGMQGLDVGAVAGGCMIVVLVTAFLLAAALVVSLVTRTQIVAAICTFIATWLMLVVGWLVGATPGVDERSGAFVSITLHVEEFSRGVVDARTIVFYVSATVFTLFMATRMLESRRWR